MQCMPRVALFADTFYEVNGAARTCREWAVYAERKRIPLFVLRCGRAAGGAGEPEEGIDIQRSPMAIRVDADLCFDPLFYRHLDTIEKPLREFRPDVIHLTSPGDLGILGAIMAAKLRVPLALSWHTNLHEFAARRIACATSWLPRRWSQATCARVEQFVLDRVAWFFGRGDLIFAPNSDLVELLHRRTGKRVLPMARGVDTAAVHSGEARTLRRRNRDRLCGAAHAGEERALSCTAGGEPCGGWRGNVRFLIVGGGGERAWLEKALPTARFTGVLTGEALARAYASMDIFAFPSRTDTFGNVVQEAMASGVPAVVTDAGGPRYIVNHGVTGWVAADDERVLRLRSPVGARRCDAAPDGACGAAADGCPLLGRGV